MTGPLRLDRQQGLVRVVRAGMLTVPAVGSATLAHASVDGCVSLVAVVLAAGLCWPAAVVLLRAQRRLPALLVGWFVLAQGVTHLLVEQMCGDAATVHASLVEHLVTMGVNPGMLTMHTGSALFTAVLFGRADAGLWAAQALVRAGARALLMRGAGVVPFGLPPAPLPVGVTSGVRRPRVLWEAAAPLRRGPPALLAH